MQRSLAKRKPSGTTVMAHQRASLLLIILASAVNGQQQQQLMDYMERRLAVLEVRTVRLGY